MKKRYMITYNLKRSQNNFNAVTNAIRGASDGVCIACMDSVYMIRSDLEDADDVFNQIRPCINNDDDVMIMEVNRNYHGWLSQQNLNYVRDIVFSQPSSVTRGNK